MSRLEARCKGGKPHIFVNNDLDSATGNVLHFGGGELQSHPFKPVRGVNIEFRVLPWNNPLRSVMVYRLAANDDLRIELSGQFSVGYNLINLKSDPLLKRQEISLKQSSIMIVYILTLNGPRTVCIP